MATYSLMWLSLNIISKRGSVSTLYDRSRFVPIELQCASIYNNYYTLAVNEERK